MRKITITIDTVNDAFADSPESEVARILREAADRLESGYVKNLMDINGNKVGTVEIE